MNVGLTFNKPKQFVYDRLKMKLFCSKQREAFWKIETHLGAKYAASACARPVWLIITMFQNIIEEVEILLHKLFSINDLRHVF